MNNYQIVNNHFVFSDEFIKNLSYDDIKNLIIENDNIQLFKLPNEEIKFFEWLKEKDPSVWDDLWKEDDITLEPYIVSLSHLGNFVENKDRGYPICDLFKNENYYFSPEHMTDEESKVHIEVANIKLKERSRMSITQLLALEISIGAIDIWHFSFKYKLDLEACKNAVQELVQDDALVHLKEYEHLIPFIR